MKKLLLSIPTLLAASPAYAFDLNGDFVFNLLPVTPYPEFNWFFTMVTVCGLVAVCFNMVIRVISRS
jgi:hypothetical protein